MSHLKFKCWGWQWHQSRSCYMATPICSGLSDRPCWRPLPSGCSGSQSPLTPDLVLEHSCGEHSCPDLSCPNCSYTYTRLRGSLYSFTFSSALPAPIPLHCVHPLQPKLKHDETEPQLAVTFTIQCHKGAARVFHAHCHHNVLPATPKHTRGATPESRKLEEGLWAK